MTLPPEPMTSRILSVGTWMETMRGAVLRVVRLKTLSCYDALIEEATATGYVKESDVEVLRQWRNNPSEWNK